MDSKQFEIYSVSFLLVVLFMPYFVTIESLLGGSRLNIISLLWAIRISGNVPEVMIPLLQSSDYFAFWIWNFLILIVVLFSLRNNEKPTVRVYLLRIGFVIILQSISFLYLLTLLAGGLPITFIPIPIPAIIAFILTFRIKGPKHALWDESPSSD
ncbi:MAG: hypothetical protein ACFFFK_13275 [Candidatus Thorarchaeota archaeon]